MSTVYELVTDRMVAALEAGTVPWQKPWSGDAMPRSMTTGKPYRGVNVFLLGCAQIEADHSSAWWGTYRVIQAAGGQVRKGERSSLIVLWRPVKGRDDDGRREGESTLDDLKPRFVLRYFSVFNADQADWAEGLPAEWAPTETDDVELDPIEACEALTAGYVGGPGPALRDAAQAWYRPALDVVGMPALGRFASAAHYYSTLFHELTHSTGHASRLARPGVTDGAAFGSHTYSREELIAEMGAAFLCGRAGIANETEANSAAYLASWVRVLRGDSKLVVAAAGAAQRAADLIAPADADAMVSA